jgi:UDP-glucose 4-epimerase
VLGDVLITGAAGFIGSHLVDRMIEKGHRVIGIDNFVRGRIDNLSAAFASGRFTLIRADLADRDATEQALRDALSNVQMECVWHLAANSDIPAGIDDPTVDLRATFLTTFNLLALMRRYAIPAIAFASSSAVYGVHNEPINEETGPLMPISNYGAMKLASEGAISASVESFLRRAVIFRFPNVVGGRTTHGVIYDLLNKLSLCPNELEVLGDGRQQKPYLHVSELLDAMFWIWDNAAGRLAVYNIGNEDTGATVAAIAEAVIRSAQPTARVRFTGGDRGWVGDVPRVRYSTEKLRSLGWRAKLSSMAAIELACREMIAERASPCRS